jgi:hypothetical protein
MDDNAVHLIGNNAPNEACTKSTKSVQTTNETDWREFHACDLQNPNGNWHGPGCGANANVYITLFGSIGNGGERLLDNADDNFENGKTDVFSIEMRDIGEIHTVRIRHDDSGSGSGWFLDRIVVHREDTDEEWAFPCMRWLAVDEDDRLTDRILDRA